MNRYVRGTSRDAQMFLVFKCASIYLGCVLTTKQLLLVLWGLVDGWMDDFLTAAAVLSLALSFHPFSAYRQEQGNNYVNQKRWQNGPCSINTECRHIIHVSLPSDVVCPGPLFLVRPLPRQKTFPFHTVSNCASTGAAWSPLYS